jgi:hypothetical protein
MGIPRYFYVIRVSASVWSPSPNPTGAPPGSSHFGKIKVLHRGCQFIFFERSKKWQTRNKEKAKTRIRRRKKRRTRNC